MTAGRDLEVLATGPLVTVQDRGRVGFAHLGVPRAGALDEPAAAIANRLVGNPPDAAVLEVLLGSLVLRARTGCWVAVTGAPAEVRIDGRARSHGTAEWVPAGGRLALGRPRTGARSYVAVAGGIAVDAVLGSRSTDTLAWVGPPRVEPDAILPIGSPTGPPRSLDVPMPPRTGDLPVAPGPRADRFPPGALDRLCATTWTVAAASDRVGLRLGGPPLAPSEVGELPSEGMVVGAVQVPPSGRPVVFLADHPTTGGYPVLGVVPRADVWRCAQLLPGDPVRFTPARRPR